MRKEYTVVVKDSPEVLAAEVNKMLNTSSGMKWELVGGVSVAVIHAPKAENERPVVQDWYAQALVRSVQPIGV